MTFSHCHLPWVLVASVALLVTSVRAADDDDEDEEDFGTFGFLAASPRSLNVSMKVTQGAQVKFGNLGEIPANFDHSKGAQVGRLYMDGYVQKDALRDASFGDASEKVGTGTTVIHNLGSRYEVRTAEGGLIGNYLSYDAARTRSWQYNNKEQAEELPGYIAFHNYSVRSSGSGFSSTKALNGGFEIGLSHAVTNPTKRFSLYLTASIGLAGIYNNKSGTILSRLLADTDYYRYFPYSGTDAPVNLPPDANTPLGYRYRAPGNLLPGTNSSVTEDTTALSQNPDIDQGETDEGETEVEGNWRLKGAYFTIKLGPQINAMLTRSIGLNAGIGFAGTYASTRYSAFESFEVAGVEDPIEYSPEATTKSILLAGYYANIDATWALNDRTGIFAGFSYEQLGEYNQKLENRTVKVDLSATAGVRGGFNIKF
jgi:hypothetical protein